MVSRAASPSTLGVLTPSLTALLAVAAVALIGVGCTISLDLTECGTDDECEEEYGGGWQCTDDYLCEPPPAECEDDTDCEDEYGYGWTCRDRDGECLPPENVVFCEDTSQCEAIQGDGWTCSDEAQVCEPPPGSIPCSNDEDCASHQECSIAGLCQDEDTGDELLGGPCQIAVGDVDDDDAFLVGVLLPFSGDEAGFGESLLNAIDLARADFDAVDGVDDRQIGLIGCDTESEESLAVEGAEHLADIDVQAVIGPDWSSQTEAVANEVTIDAEMVLVSPSATAASISELDDNGLVWRTVASDEGQGQALGKLVDYALDTLPHYTGVDEDDIPETTSVAVMHRNGDPYGEGLRAAIERELPDEYTEDEGRHYFSAYEPDADSTDIATSLLSNTADADDFGPDVIVLLGASEAWEVAEIVDGEFANPPLFVFADAARVPGYTEDITDALEGRIWGTAPRNASDLNYEPYTSFRLRYQSQFDEDPEELQFVPNAFDALYILGLGAAYGGFSGLGISEGMTQLSDGDTFGPTASELPGAMHELSEGNSINFDGASWVLNFDDTGTPSPMPTALWCFEAGGLPEQAVIFDENGQFTPIGCGDETEPAQNDGECNNDDDCTEYPDNATPICQQGDCLWTCTGGLSPCDGQCVDTESDDDHCGECGESCGDSEVCADGTCSGD